MHCTFSVVFSVLNPTTVLFLGVPASVDDVLNNGDDPLGDFVETYWGALLQKRDLMTDQQQERFTAIMSMIGDEDQKTGQEIAINFLKGDQVGVLDYMTDMYNKNMKTIFVATLLVQVVRQCSISCEDAFMQL